MKRAAVITLSDKGYAGEREDISGNVIENVLLQAGITVTRRVLLPDDFDLLCSALKSAARDNDFVFTTGGTGFSKRDITPEATLSVIEKECEGVTQAITFNSLQYTPRAMLSRAVCGICGECIILNLPGSPKAVKENLDFVLPSLLHGSDILLGAGECAR